MKKYIPTLVIILFTSQMVLGQKKEYAVKKGNLMITSGYGFPGILRYILKLKTNREDYTIKGSGPYLFKAEYMISNKFGIGINASYNSSRLFWFDPSYDTIQKLYRDFEFGIKGKELSGAIRGNYHFWHRKKIDSYAGLGFGTGYINLHSYTLAHNVSIDINYTLPRPYYIDATWGFRYFPIKNLGIYTEVGLGKSWILYKKYFLPEAIIQGGLTLKI